MENRPQGRRKNITGEGKGIYRRGEGQGTGPVGSGTGPNGGAQRPQGAGGTQQRSSGTRSGGMSPLALIVIAALVLFGGGGGLLSTLLGGGAAQQPAASSTVSPASSSAGYGVSQSILQSLSSGSTLSGWTTASNDQKLDTAVAAGSRAKRTTILGGGKDTVTVMVYMCGTDLESKNSMGTRDLMEMIGAEFGDNVHVLVYTGGAKKWNNQVISASKNQIYEVVSGGLRLLVENAGSPAMTDPSTLSSFIQWCAKNYPANRNELIFWDHGGGSVSGYGYDEKYASSGSMSLAGIDSALKSAGVTFDFIGFDACLMATAENGLMLEQYADYMIASEETEPGIGWYYTDWLTALGKNTSMATTEIGRKIVDDFVTTCASSCKGQPATLSVVDLAELANTVPASLKTFSQSLSTLITNNQYQQVSAARNGTREFARSTKIDQIDLVHFAQNLGNAEGKALSEALLGAVKYNRTSSDMNNAYGLSIYFPYRKASSVDQAVRTYDAIGMDESYAQCIREFASLEVSGQVSGGGTASPLPSLLGELSGLSVSGGQEELISALLGGFLGGDFGSVGLSSSNAGFLNGRSMPMEDTVEYLASHYFDPTKLAWQRTAAGEAAIVLPEEQWALVEGLDLNVFYDDGAGWIDLGLDNVFEFDGSGNLLAPAEDTWLAVNEQPVAYYHEYTTGRGDDAVTSGYIPALLNGERVELIVVWDAQRPDGAIVGARTVYASGETETVAKSLTEIADGDVIDFLCDYYTYDGAYEDSYKLGDQLVVGGPLQISDVYIDGDAARTTYRFTDLYQQHYWTEPAA